MSGARSILWHEQCLENHERSVLRSLGEGRRIWAEEGRRIQAFRMYKAQIALAKKEGKEAFDSDTYGKNRKASSAEARRQRDIEAALDRAETLVTAVQDHIRVRMMPATAPSLASLMTLNAEMEDLLRGWGVVVPAPEGAGKDGVK